MKLVRQPRNVPQDFGNRALGASGPAGGRQASAVGRQFERGAVRLALVLVAGVAGCGYQPVYSSQSGRHYEVVAGHYATSSFEAVQVATAGVRSELGAAQALGSGFPRVVVEVLRVDERSIGVGSADGERPLARGSEIVVVGRAQVFQSEGAAVVVDTGDLSRAAQFASGASPSADAARRARAVRDAARTLGKALGRAVLGLPEPAEG